MNIRTRPPVGGGHRLFDVHLPPAQPPTYFPPQFPMGTSGCMLPQQDYYIRFPYYQYPQYAQYPSYLGYPGPGNELYRMVAPQPILPPHLGLYQGMPPAIPPGFNMIRPHPWPMPPPLEYGLPGVCAQQNNHTRSLFYDQSATVTGRPRSQEAAGQTHVTATLHDATNTFHNIGQRNVSHKTRWKSDQNRYKSTQQPPNKKGILSKTHRRNTASQRLRKLSAKKSKYKKDNECKLTRSYNSSEAFEISSILKEDDDNYETCEEEEIVDGKTPKNNIFPYNLFTQKKNNTILDYTLITNDKSFSHVNYNPGNTMLTKHQTKPDKITTKKHHTMGPPNFENKPKLDVNSNSIMSNASFKNQNSTGFWDESIRCNNNDDQSFHNISMTDHAGQEDSLANRNRLSAFSSISNSTGENNNNYLRVNQTGLWWDKSTDVGYKSIQKTPASSFENGNLQKDLSVHSSGSNQPYIQEIKGFVVVDTAYKRKDCVKADPPTYLIEDPNNNDATVDNPNHQTKKSCLQKNDDVSGTYSKLKKLDVDWKAMRKVVPQEYLRRSFNNDGSVQYDFGFPSRQVSFLQDSSFSNGSENQNLPDQLLPVANLNLNDDKISDQDDAIVAVIKQVDCLNLNASLKCDNELEKLSKNDDSLLHSSIHPFELNNKSKLIKLPTVSTSNAGSSWGKQDVNVLLIVSNSTTALTSSNNPCVKNASTPSTTRVIYSTEEGKSDHYRKLLPVNKLISQLTPIHRTEKMAKSLPASPIHSTKTKLKNSKPLAKHTSMVNLASFTTVGGSFSSIDFDIDCKKFNNRNEKVSTPHSKVFKTIPFTAQKKDSKCDNNKANHTYVITPGSSQLEFTSSKVKPRTYSISDKNQTNIFKSKKLNHSNLEHRSKSLKNSGKKNQVSRTNGKIARPCKLPVSSKRVGKPVILPKCHAVKSSIVSPSSSVNALTPPTTPKALVTYGRLGPNGSKTITKQKKRLTTSARNHNARRSLPTASNESGNASSKKSIISSEMVIVASDSGKKKKENESKIELKKSGISTSKFVKKTPKLPSSKSANLTTSSSSIVSTKPPSRRSPRTMHSTLSAVHLAELKDGIPRNLNQKSKSCSRLARVFEDQKNPQSKTITEVEVSKDGITTSPSTAACKSTRMEMCGNVQPTIESVVHTLSSQPEIQQKNECPTPSYLAIRDQYVKKFINWKNRNKTVEVSTVHKSLVSSFGRPNSLPSSPTQQRSFSSFQRSASLSDVFYDSVSESSYIGALWNTNRNGKNVPMKLNSLQNWNRKNKMVTSCTEATYISYTPPTISPQASNIIKLPFAKTKMEPIQFKMTNLNLDQGGADLSGNADEEIKNDIDKDDNDSCAFEKNERVRLLSQELEMEIRQKAELLVESVNESIVAHNNTNRTSVAQLEKNPTENLSSYKVMTHKLKSLPLLGTVGNDNNSKPLHLTKSMEKLNVPPKKPPRSNSPNFIRHGVDSTASSSNQSSKSLHPNEQPAKTNSLTFQNYPVSPVIPYYPLITAYPGLSPHRHPHFLSPALIPYTYGQHFLWNLQQQHVGSMEQYDSEISISHNSEKSDRSTEKNDSNQLSSYTIPATAFIPQPSLVLPLEEHLRLQNSMNNATTKVPPTAPQNTGAYYMHQKPKYPSMPRPKGTPSKKLTIRRRRSFSGINSFGVGRTRHNRHVHANIKYLTSSRAMKYNQIFNSSHPLPKPTRRPRFVRSSLTEDSVFQTMQPKSNKFFTKPIVPKPPKLDTDIHHTLNAVENLVINSETETGYHSSTATSSSCSPEKKEETSESAKNLKGVVHKEKETKLAAIPEDSVQTNFNVQRTSESMTEATQQQEVIPEDLSDMNDTKVKEKNRRKYSKFKQLKKLWNSKKTKQLASQSQTDFRLIEEPTISTLKRSVTDPKLPPIADSIHKNMSDIPENRFHWKKNTEKAHQNNDSTLKAETSGYSTYRVQNINNPGYRPSYDIKMALLKPSFVGIAPSEIKVDNQLMMPEDINTNGPERVDKLSDTIRPITISNRRNIATTPGIRINSETGDFLEEERHNYMEENDPKAFKFLSSTVIDDGIVHASLPNDENTIKALAELEEATTEKYVRTIDRPNRKPKKNLKFMKNKNRRLSTEI